METDERGIYLQEQGQPKTIELRIFKKGQLVQEPVELKLEQYVMTDFDRSAGPPLPSTPASPDQHIVEMALTGVERGLAHLTLTPKKPGTCIIRFVPTAQAGWPFNQKFTTSFFISLRVFPADNYDEVPDSALTFDFIYREVLRYFDLLYPGISALTTNRRYHHPNSGDENNMREYALETKARLEKEITDPGYMPRTRDLSEGKRKLLLRWCERISPADPLFET